MVSWMKCFLLCVHLSVSLSVWSGAEVAEYVVSCVLDEMFAAETAAAHVISVLLDQVMNKLKPRRHQGLCSATI